MASRWARTLPPALASISLYQLPSPPRLQCQNKEAAASDKFLLRRQVLWCEPQLRASRWPQGFDGPERPADSEDTSYWDTNATTVKDMTLSTFMRFLEDVDPELAAKGTAGLMRLKPDALPQGLAEVAPAEVELLLRYAQVAVAVYGPAILNVAFYPDVHTGVPPAPGSVSGWLQTVQSHLPPGVQLLHAEPSSTWLRPAYFIGIDTERKCVILSIRGTLSPEDILTDLSAEEADTPWGPSHKGMLLSAKALLQEVCPRLEEIMERYGLEKLDVVGHSLGAGIATYISLLLEDLHNPAAPNVSISCYAFGAPGLAHIERAASPGSGKVSIVTVVNGYDWISRLSYGHVIDLLHRGQQEFQTMFGSVKSWLGVQRGDAEKIASTEFKQKPAKLYPCGQIILLLPDQGAFRSSQTHLENLDLDPSMFTAHFPNNYEAGLRSALPKL